MLSAELLEKYHIETEMTAEQYVILSRNSLMSPFFIFRFSKRREAHARQMKPDVFRSRICLRQSGNYLPEAEVTERPSPKLLRILRSVSIFGDISNDSIRRPMTR